MPGRAAQGRVLQKKASAGRLLVVLKNQGRVGTDFHAGRGAAILAQVALVDLALGRIAA